MPTLRAFTSMLFAGVLTLLAPMVANAASPAGPGVPISSYILGDSIAYGLQLDGLEAKLKHALGGPARISFDGGRSLTTPGNQIKKTAFESVDEDRATIAAARVIVIVLGMNPLEASFANSQQQLMKKLKALAPEARYFWVDIGATISIQVPGWNQRNKTIYDNAERLGYEVISRYKAIFGPCADPLNIIPGQNFPDWVTEPGYGGPGNVHGFYSELSQAILNAVSNTPAAPACVTRAAGSSYVLGDSIVYGLHLDQLAAKLQQKLGGTARLSYDVGRSITTPGSQIKQSALESVERDKAFIAKASVIVVALGTNQYEESFAESQQLLMQTLKALAPQAKYYWIDIGATLATQVPGWNARNKTIYDNAAALGYTIISRYKTIFGPQANPLNITPGQNFPGWVTEPGYGEPGNVHGFNAELSQAILSAL